MANDKTLEALISANMHEFGDKPIAAQQICVMPINRQYPLTIQCKSLHA